VSRATQESPLGAYEDKALDLRAEEVESLLSAKIRLEHDGQIIDGEFTKYDIINGEVHAIARLEADTPGKQRLLDNIGPGKRYGSVSVTVHWPMNADKSVVLGPAKIKAVAITEKGYYTGTDIVMCASKQSHDLCALDVALGMCAYV
jgi:hypothetical protein